MRFIGSRAVRHRPNFTRAKEWERVPDAAGLWSCFACGTVVDGKWGKRRHLECCLPRLEEQAARAEHQALIERDPPPAFYDAEVIEDDRMDRNMDGL